VSQGLAGVRKAARKDKKVRFTALLHHLTVDRLRESFYALKRKAAPGVDGVTWQEYEPGLQESLIDLHSRVHRGTYRAKPSRRVYIEKADGRQRPLGIAALEDKIVQQAVVAVLNQIYEEDFLGFSYGFRPGRTSERQRVEAIKEVVHAEAALHVLAPVCGVEVEERVSGGKQFHARLGSRRDLRSTISEPKPALSPLISSSSARRIFSDIIW